MIPPLNYVDLIHFESVSYFFNDWFWRNQRRRPINWKASIITLREHRKAKAVKSGNAVLTGTFGNKIYNFASSLLKNKELNGKNLKRFKKKLISALSNHQLKLAILEELLYL